MPNKDAFVAKIINTRLTNIFYGHFYSRRKAANFYHPGCMCCFIFIIMLNCASPPFHNFPKDLKQYGMFSPSIFIRKMVQKSVLNDLFIPY